MTKEKKSSAGSAAPLDSGAGASAITRGAWLALTAALLGWMFDGFEMGLFSMVGRAAIQDLLGIVGKPTDAQEADIGFYFGVVIAVFLVGAATGGVLFGWLGDRIGRVRAMSLSVATYAIFTGLCGIVAEPWQIAVLRFIAALGMGGEWALGVALVMEVWPNRSRALMAGLIGAAANVGYLLVGLIGLWLSSILDHAEQWLQNIGLSSESAATLVAFKGWRLMMLMGATPALLTFFFRLFVPESQKWEQERGRGSTSQWATRDLLGVVIGATGPALIVYVWAANVGLPFRVIGTLLGLAIATVGYVYPVVQYLKRTFALGGVTAEQSWQPTLRRMLLGACLSGVALLGTWGSTQWAPAWAGKLTEGTPAAAYAREYSQIALAVGAIIGTIAAALIGGWLGRRITYFLMCISSLVTALLFFQGNHEFGTFFLVTCFLAGACTAAFYGWLPLYLPELFATKVRATGQGFAFNFGRIIAAIGALQAGLLTKVPDTTLFGHVFTGGYPLACSTMSLVYLAGLVLIWFAPETRGQPLPE